MGYSSYYGWFVYSFEGDLMIKGVVALFELLKGLIEFLITLIETAVHFVTMIPSLVSYFNSSLSMLPTFLFTLFSAAFGFIVIKAIHKYLL